MAPKLNVAEAAIIAFIETLGKIANSSDRHLVRDAGAISALVQLMMNGTGDVPGRAASVLRDLAQDKKNNERILEADGVTQLVQMLSKNNKTIATEAADALRSLCAGNLAVCSAIRSKDGIKSLVKLLKDGHASAAAMQAANALSNMSQADPSCRKEIGKAGGVQALVSMLTGGFGGETASMRKRGQESGWATSKNCEETVRALHELRGEPTCCAVLLTESTLRALVMLMLLAGLQSESAVFAAAIIVSLLRNDSGAQPPGSHRLARARPRRSVCPLTGSPRALGAWQARSRSTPCSPRSARGSRRSRACRPARAGRSRFLI